MAVSKWRQISVVLASQLGAFSLGGDFAYPTVLLQQLASDTSIIQPDMEVMSWIASVNGIAGIGAVLMPMMTQKIGRKYTFIGSCVVLMIGWILAFTAKNLHTIILGEVFLGLGGNCITIVNYITVSEMMAPAYRTVSMMMIGISQSSGLLLVGFIGTVLHWKVIAIIMCSPLIVALVLISFLPESPAWLAYKNNYSRCEEAFKWLRGTGDEANKELQILIAFHRVRPQILQKRSTLQELGSKIRMKDFYMPVIHMFLILFNFYICGGVSLYIYSKYVIVLATGNNTAALYGYLFKSVLLFIGGIISVISIRYLKSKTILYIGGIGNISLLIASLISYLQSVGVITKDSLLFIYFFLGYFVFSYSTTYVLTFAMAVELIPVKHRGIGGALYTIFTCSLHFTTTKLLPYLIIHLTLAGMLLLCGLGGIISVALISKYVPETKGHTLQEIENFYNSGHFTINKDLINDNDTNSPFIKD